MLIYVGTDDGILTLDVSLEASRARRRAAGLAGTAIRAITPQSARPDVVFVGADDGFFWSRDAGASWTRSAGWPEDRACWAIAIHPLDPDRLLAGSQPPALFWSDDGGQTWREIGAIQTVPGRERWTFPHPPHQAHVTGVAFDPSDSDALFVSVEVGGVLRSLDGGRSWQVSDHQLDPDVHIVQPWPGMPSTILAATGAGVFRSQDRGVTWQLAGQQVAAYTVALAMQRRPPYGAMVAMRGPTVLAWTVDGGVTWEPLHADLPPPRFGVQALVSSGVNPALFLYGAQDITDVTRGRIWWSETSGRNWQPLDLFIDGLIYRLALHDG